MTVTDGMTPLEKAEWLEDYARNPGEDVWALVACAETIKTLHGLLVYKDEVIDQRNLMCERQQQEINRLKDALRGIMRLAPTSALVQSVAKRALKDRSPDRNPSGNSTV